MMPSETICAAVDLGATSGRVVVGRWNGEGLDLTEVHRFPNAVREMAGRAYWDVPGLWEAVKKGLAAAIEQFPVLRSVGVDSWAVDHVLMDESGRPLFPVHAYRDLRTEPLAARLKEDGIDRIHGCTGIPPYPYNTSLQLQETLQTMPGLRDRVYRCLFLPDYFNFLLSGEVRHEVSIASHSQLLAVDRLDWSPEALDYFGIPREWFTEPTVSPQPLGRCQLWEESDVEVIAVSGHDTASAFLAIPASDDGSDVYLSTGTWSLIGFEADTPLLGAEALAGNISNERMGDGRFRPLKSCLGLWLLERLLDDFDKRPETAREWSELITSASAAHPPSVLIDVTDSRFFNPRSMRGEINAFLREAKTTPPSDLPAYVRLVCASLAEGHRAAIAELENLSGKRFRRALLTGGGAHNSLLCQLTADACQLPVLALDFEGSAVGNLAAQLLALGAVEDLSTFRTRFGKQLQPRTFTPTPRKE